MKIPNLKTAFTKALIVLMPTYSVAFLTEKMVYVVPMLAACSFFAASIEPQNLTNNRVDEESEADDSQIENVFDGD